MAYCFITIPSLTDIYTRLKLYFLSAQTALANQAMGQGIIYKKVLDHVCLFRKTSCYIDINLVTFKTREKYHFRSS